jgi:hypothetical protein
VRHARYPTEAAGYDLQHEVGRGATASVWAAHAKACQEVVAVKMFYLDRLKGDKVLQRVRPKHPQSLHEPTGLQCLDLRLLQAAQLTLAGARSAGGCHHADAEAPPRSACARALSGWSHLKQLGRCELIHSHNSCTGSKTLAFPCHPG